MRRRRAVTLGLGGIGAAVAFMLGLGAWQTRVRSRTDAVLPLPVNEMNWQLTDHLGQDPSCTKTETGPLDRGRPRPTDSHAPHPTKDLATEITVQRLMK